MLKGLTKNANILLLLTLVSSQNVCAGVDIYRYDGKLPFIKMMLGMMDAMGVIDKLPANGRYGTNPYSRYSNNPYSNNPFARTPWSQSPWTQSNQYGESGVSPIWGSPDWGVLPIDRYTRNYNNLYGSNYLPHWSQSDLDGWVDEPWEVSKWNNKAENPRPTAGGQANNAQVAPQALQQVSPQPYPQQPGNAPLVQNFNFGAPDGANAESRSANRSPLAKLAPPTQPGWQSAQQAPRPPVRQPLNQAGNQARNQSPLAKKSYRNLSQKPCVTEFCGLKKPNLNGLWVSQSGEMLGINDHRYLWSDGNSRYLTGQIKVQNEYLMANVDEHEQIMRFKYKLAGNQLLTMQPDGTIREFARMSRDQYKNFNSGRQPKGYTGGSSQGYGQNYSRYY